MESLKMYGNIEQEFPHELWGVMYFHPEITDPCANATDVFIAEGTLRATKENAQIAAAKGAPQCTICNAVYSYRLIPEKE